MEPGAGARAPGREAEMVVAELWAALDELAGELDLACGPGCAACCTDRVLLTGVEADILIAHLRAAGGADLLLGLQRTGVEPGARPASTFNALARLYLAGEEPPAEGAGTRPGLCPLLHEGRCQAYQARPLACRVMVSRRRCQAGGWAEQDPWWVTLGTAFFQLAEQASAGRPFGLLAEVVADAQGSTAGGLLECEDLPGIPAPPEHQARLGGVLERLFRRPCGEMPLGLLLQRLRRPGAGPA